MPRPLRKSLVAAAVGLFLIAPLAASPADSFARPTPTPPPDPTSAFCQEFWPSVDTILAAIDDMSLIDDTMPTDQVMAIAGSTFNTLATELKNMSLASPPALMASQLTEQITYWSGAAQAISKGNMLSSLLTQARMTKEMTNFQTFLTAGTAYCDENATPPPPDSVTLDETEWSLSDARQTHEFTVTAGGAGNWTAKVDPGQNWLKVTHGTGSSGGKFVVLAKKDTGAARSGTITVTEGNASTKLTVKQSGKTVVKATLAQPTVPAAGGTVTVTLTTDPAGPTTGATISTSAAVKKWITNPDSSVDGSLTLTVGQNPGKARTGKVTIKLGSASAVVLVKQDAA